MWEDFRYPMQMKGITEDDSKRNAAGKIGHVKTHKLPNGTQSQRPRQRAFVLTLSRIIQSQFFRPSEVPLPYFDNSSRLKWRLFSNGTALPLRLTSRVFF